MLNKILPVVVIFFFCYWYALCLLWCSEVGLLELVQVDILDWNSCITIVHLEIGVIFSSIRWFGKMDPVCIGRKTISDSQSRSIHILSSSHTHLLSRFNFTLSFNSFSGKLLKQIHCLVRQWHGCRNAPNKRFAWLATLYEHLVIFLEILTINYIQLILWRGFFMFVVAYLLLKLLLIFPLVAKLFFKIVDFLLSQ